MFDCLGANLLAPAGLHPALYIFLLVVYSLDNIAAVLLGKFFAGVMLEIL